MHLKIYWNGLKNVLASAFVLVSVISPVAESKNAETLCTYPSTRWFPVYEIEQNEGILWYRLGNHSWVAQQNGVTYKMLG